MHPWLEDWVQGNSLLIEEKSGLCKRELNTRIKHEDLDNKVRVLEVGPEKDHEMKTVLLLGETGSGKTCSINSLVNRIFGVELEDNIRLCLPDQMDDLNKRSTQSQTDYTTAFIIYYQDGMIHPYNYMIIDTPGLGDTEGLQKQEFNERCLRFYLANEEWITHLNSVGLVWKSCDKKFDQRKREILLKIKELLGFDIKHLTDVLLTFSQHDEDDSGAIEVIKESGTIYNKIFSFENGYLYKPLSRKTKPIVEYMWKETSKNLDDFLNSLNQREGVELKITARLFLAMLKYRDSQRRLKDVHQQKDDALDQLGQQQRQLSELVGSEMSVQWEDIKELDTSEEEIILDDGRHIHFCNECKKVCTSDCKEDHKAKEPPVVNNDSWRKHYISEFAINVTGAIAGILIILPPVKKILGEAASVLPLAVTGVVGIGKRILGFMRTSKNRKKTQALHAQEGKNPCSKCRHLLSAHEIRNKILAKHANFDQKMELLKKLKYQEVMGKREDLQAQIEASLKEMEEIDNEEQGLTQDMRENEMEIEHLQEGHS